MKQAVDRRRYERGRCPWRPCDVVVRLNDLGGDPLRSANGEPLILVKAVTPKHPHSQITSLWVYVPYNQLGRNLIVSYSVQVHRSSDRLLISDKPALGISLLRPAGARQRAGPPAVLIARAGSPTSPGPPVPPGGCRKAFSRRRCFHRAYGVQCCWSAGLVSQAEGAPTLLS